MMTIVANIDNQYHIAGAMIQRLCGDEHGVYHDDGRLHSYNVHGFLKIVQRAKGASLCIASSEVCQLILSGQHDKAFKELFGKSRRSNLRLTEWIFILPHNRRDSTDTFWSLIGIDLVNRAVCYHFLHALNMEDSSSYQQEITKFIQYIDFADNKSSTTWLHHPIVFSDCIKTNSGIWICLLVQALIH